MFSEVPPICTYFSKTGICISCFHRIDGCIVVSFGRWFLVNFRLQTKQPSLLNQQHVLAVSVNMLPVIKATFDAKSMTKFGDF